MLKNWKYYDANNVEHTFTDATNPITFDHDTLIVGEWETKKIAKFKGVSTRNTTEYEKAFSRFGKPDIVYEDEHVLFLNKPIGVLSQKSVPSDLSANEWLIGYMLNKGETDASKLSFFTPSVCWIFHPAPVVPSWTTRESSGSISDPFSCWQP